MTDRAHLRQAELRAGDRLGDYHIVDHLANGGMADIYLAHHSYDEEIVALKRLRPVHANDPQYLTMLVEEARLMERMSHPNVVTAYDTSSVESHGYFTMDYVPGATLLQTLKTALRRNGALPIQVGISIVMGAAAGLHYAHELTSNGVPLGVIHRDVSMSNVLIGFNGDVKIADFGVAKVEDRELHTGDNLIKGKIGYMSPEQAKGAPLDRRSDVFGLGIILYELTTGKRLFTGENSYERLVKVARADITRPSLVRWWYPSDLEAIVMRALAKDPQDRYPSAQAMLDDLAAIQQRSDITPTATVTKAMHDLFIDVDDFGAEPPSNVHESVETASAISSLSGAETTEIMNAPPVLALEHLRREQRMRRPFGPRLALGTIPPVLERSPMSLTSLDKATRQLEAGRYRAALDTFGEVLEVHPGDTGSRVGYYIAQGCLALEGGRQSVASRYWGFALDIAPREQRPVYWSAALRSAGHGIEAELRRLAAARAS